MKFLNDVKLVFAQLFVLVLIFLVLAFLFGGEPAALLIIAAYFGACLNEFFRT